VRRHDPARRLWVLRGDKLFYGVLSDPHGGYAEWAKTPKEVLDLIFKYDPELIVVEDPQIYFDLPGARLLRQVLEDHPKRFRLVKEFLLSSNQVTFRGKRLLVYRNLVRNPKRVEVLEIKMLGLDRSLQASPPVGQAASLTLDDVASEPLALRGPGTPQFVSPRKSGRETSKLDCPCVRKFSPRLASAAFAT
jgi:hypothetical protein